MDPNLLRKVTRRFNRYRAPECRARVLRNEKDSLKVEFRGTKATSGCYFDENFVDYNYYLKDLADEGFLLAEIRRPEEGRFIVVYKKAKSKKRRG